MFYFQITNLGKYMCNTCQKVYKTETGLCRHISQKHSSSPSSSLSSSSSSSSSSSEKNKYYQKLERLKFDEIFKESVDSCVMSASQKILGTNSKPQSQITCSQIIIYMKMQWLFIKNLLRILILKSFSVNFMVKLFYKVKNMLVSKIHGQC